MPNYILNSTCYLDYVDHPCSPTNAYTYENPYHNWQHITQMLRDADQIDLEFDPNLLFAIMYHDALYDGKPDNERRSASYAETMLGWHTPSGVSIPKVKSLIMSTVTHSLSEQEEDPRLIKLDLMAIAIPNRLKNYNQRVIEEACKLHNMQEKDLIPFRYKFLRRFQRTMLNNYNQTCDPYWQSVYDGIETLLKV
ncbi:hypothetical protein [Flexibacterium corallicola]|uniref:hypothetical protein n=1 Tax=Flexibacterium corallicola TaxID=3037259 RepID=UPI00286F5FB3|nr:hypothetical protein [Pseudovibrio sp. M1P-2-3]